MRASFLWTTGCSYPRVAAAVCSIYHEKVSLNLNAKFCICKAAYGTNAQHILIYVKDLHLSTTLLYIRLRANIKFVVDLVFKSYIATF